ncbi:MAG TPA: class I SAM-dependent methyltransferase [Actinomycetota bacterium]|jgi:ubiquinone/menaquinone biosynthesis C-methylase UbiE|nr:class I SAM-dependent methyltransferase [Actinomycetota bacterium]
MTTIAQLDERFYQDFVDEHARYDRAVRRYLREDHVVLDAGAGSGKPFPNTYKESAGRVVGLDRDPDISENPLLHHAVLGDLARLPFPEGTFDLVLAKYVFEHLEHPQEVLTELRRVSKRGGHLVFHTPNRFHYIALAAKLTPHRFHAWFRQKMWAEGHSFETFYRANDRRTLTDLSRRTGFRIVELELIEPRPLYLSFHPLTYRLGISYERLVRSFDHLKDLRANLIGVLQAL